MKRQILVIGAGFSGLASMKCIKEEGLDAVCYEKTDSFGGRWRFREESIPGVASVMKSSTSLYSKELVAFSDFPPPPDFPNYLHHKKMIEYLYLYSKKFHLLQNIRYHHEVVQVIPSEDFQQTGKWLVTTIVYGLEMKETFDGVIICSGRLSYPHIPELCNQKSFTEKIIHSIDLKRPYDYENLNVLIIGSGNSAMDAAVEISTLANQVYISTRNGAWIFPKLGPKGLPYDLVLFRRYNHILKHYFAGIMNHTTEMFLDSKFQHSTYKLKPAYRALDSNLVVNDILPDKVLTGRVCIKGPVDMINEKTVAFEDENSETAIDVIVLATGYEVKIPFLQEEFYKNQGENKRLIKGIFPTNMKHNTLALVGFENIQGPQGPISECQARVVARVLSKNLQLPSHGTEPLKSRSCSETSEQCYIEYMDELADTIGAKQSMPNLIFKDPSLFWTCLTGPFLSYQYRLTGPHSWKDARKTLMECHDRVTHSLT